MDNGNNKSSASEAKKDSALGTSVQATLDVNIQVPGANVKVSASADIKKAEKPSFFSRKPN